MPISKSFAPAPLAAALAVIANGVAGIARLWTVLRHRRAVASLLTFDDHMLRDIGVTRGDVVASLAASSFDDPSRRLRVLAVERRAGWRAQRREVMSALADGGPIHGAPVARYDRTSA